MQHLLTHSSNRDRSVSIASLRTPRAGGTFTFLLMAVVVVIVIGATALQFASDRVDSLISGLLSDDEQVTFLTTQVIRGPFEHRVLERGEIESSSNVEIRCEVRSRASSGTQILEIVPEGTVVKEGDPLVRLDDAALQQELIQQQITVSNSQSQAIEAAADLDAARLAFREYEEGTFLELEEQEESQLFVAEENLRRAEEYLEYSKRLAERGYVPEAQLDADSFAVAKAQKELGVAQTKLRVLRDFTRQKMLTQLQTAIDTAEARLKSRKKTLQLDELRLQEIEDQIEKCQIVSPTAGEVVYANDTDRRGSSGDLLIAEGRPVRERQVIIRIPDESKMRVVAKVHESRISAVQTGLPATVILDAVPDMELRGTVVSVSDYPIPSFNVYMSHIKEYEVEIDISNPPDGLRPGMTAQVNVLVEEIDEALQVPIHAVLEREGRFFCAVPLDDGSLETREIIVGSSNEDQLVILSGLKDGETVVLQPNSEKILELLDLPDESQSSDNTDAESAADSKQAALGTRSSAGTIAARDVHDAQLVRGS